MKPTGFSLYRKNSIMNRKLKANDSVVKSINELSTKWNKIAKTMDENNVYVFREESANFFEIEMIIFCIKSRTF